jgi:hypothetical protein
VLRPSGARQRTRCCPGGPIGSRSVVSQAGYGYQNAWRSRENRIGHSPLRETVGAMKPLMAFTLATREIAKAADLAVWVRRVLAGDTAKGGDGEQRTYRGPELHEHDFRWNGDAQLSGM